MGFGYNRYAMVLLGFFALGAVTGCSRGGSSGSNSASTTAPSTSNVAPTTSATPTPTTPNKVAPMLTGAEFVDADQDDRVSKGDQIVLTFDDEVAPVPAGVDVASEFDLSVAGDTLGQNATVANGATSQQLEITLGDAPLLHVGEVFDASSTAPGDASGINVAFGTGLITGVGAGSVRAAAAPLDIDSTLTPGFYAAPSLNVARGGHASVLLDDGRVLVVGGISGGSSPTYVAQAEVYDPVADAFTVVGPMKRKGVDVRMVGATATKLQSGKVLIVGGYGVEKETRKFLFFGKKEAKIDTLKSAFIFDPASDSFEQVGDLKESRHSHTATLLRDGRVLIAGGYNDSTWKEHKTQAAFEVFDPAKKTFSKIGGFLGIGATKGKEDRMAHTATAIEGGSGVLLAGGNHYTGGFLFGLLKPKLKMTKGSEVVRDASKAERAVSMNDPRFHHAAASVTPAHVLVAGGQNASAMVGSLEVYDASNDQWSTKGSLSVARTGCEIAMERTRALIIGGHDGNAETDAVDVYDVAGQAVLQTSYSLANARNNFTAVELKDGTVLVIGGMTGATKSLQSLDGQALASCERFVRP